MRLLIVEDDMSLARTLVDALQERGFETVHAGSAQAAWEALWAGPIDIVLLDVMLPEGGAAGFEWAAAVRDADFRQPILFLTALESVPDRVRALSHGDDYLAKPFALPELEARLRALGRRGEIRPRTVRRGDIVFDVESRSLWRAGTPVRLTAKEMDVLEVLMLAPGRLFRREELLDRVWGAGFETPSNLVDVYVKNIRRVLGPDTIETVRGLGYRFPAEEPS